LTGRQGRVRLPDMGMHLEPEPSGNPEYNDNEMADEDLDRQVREVQEERVAAGPAKPSFWRRLFGKK
jgi:hypothetical protein